MLEEKIDKLILVIQELILILEKNKINNEIKKLDNEFITIIEFCKMFKISKSTFYATIKNRPDFNITKIGRKSLISTNMIERFSKLINPY